MGACGYVPQLQRLCILDKCVEIINKQFVNLVSSCHFCSFSDTLYLRKGRR